MMNRFITTGLACSICIFLIIFGRDYSSCEKESIVRVLLSIELFTLFLYLYLKTSIDDNYEKEEFVLLGVACFTTMIILLIIVI